jgi:hypothetical protein
MILLLLLAAIPQCPGSVNSITTSLEIAVVREGAAQVFDGE